MRSSWTRRQAGLPSYRSNAVAALFKDWFADIAATAKLPINPSSTDLLEAKAVILVGRDGVRAVSRSCVNLNCPPEAIALLDELAWQLRALADNLKNPGSRQYLRSIQCDDLDAEEAKVVLPELHESAEDFAESARTTLQQAQAAQKPKRVGVDTQRVTVLVQVLHTGAHPPKAATGGHVRENRTSRSKSQVRKKPSRRGLE